MSVPGTEHNQLGQDRDSHGASDKTFRFKASEPTGHSSRSEEVHTSAESRRRHRHHHRHRRQHKRRRLSEDKHSDATSNLPPDVAFRESLFDALGDDEGAEFWQGVYGQPIHTYPRTYEDVDTGEIGLMDDEQYASYVRRKMWEKSREGIEAAREVKHRERKEEESRRRHAQQEDRTGSQKPPGPEYVFDMELDASLKRGQHRKDKKRWQQLWQSYLDRWKELHAIYESRTRASADETEQIFLRNKIAWPVESGKSEDIDADNIATFIAKVSVATANEEDPTLVKTSILKTERVKWHPDKIQQRYGFMQIDPSTTKNVTAVFQIIDRLWGDTRATVV